MALLSEKTQLDLLFTKMTGLTYSISELIDNCANDEEKIALYKRVSWQLKRGVVLDNEGEYRKLFGQFVPALATEIGISADSDDMDRDGDVDAEDAKMKADLQKASSIVIETSSVDSTDTTNNTTFGSGLDIEL